MNTSKKFTGLALATAAAGLFATAAVSPAFAAKEEAQVHCLGVNGCKGKSDCATASNACKGMNACKGQGMTVTTPKECADKGGKVAKK